MSDELRARIAAALHDEAHRGWHHWYPDGRDCPDGKLDADSWLGKVDPLVAALAEKGLAIVDAS